jgi:hypothetical protein
MCQLFCHHFIRVDRSASSNSGSFASATRASSMAFTSSRVVAATRLFCGAVDLPFITGCAQRVGSFTYQGQSVFSNGCFGARLHHAHCVVWCWPSRARVWCHSHCSSSQRSGRALREGSLNLPGTAVFSSASSGACLLAPRSVGVVGFFTLAGCSVRFFSQMSVLAVSVAALNDTMPIYLQSQCVQS